MTQMTITYQGELHCHAEHPASGATLNTDAPLDNGGKGESFSPTDLVATALAACILTMMAKKAENLGIAYREPRITAHACPVAQSLHPDLKQTLHFHYPL